MKQNYEIREDALSLLKGKWTNPVLVTLVLFLLSCMGAIPYVGWVITWLVCVPISWSVTIMFLQYYRTHEDMQIGNMFTVFTRNSYLRVFGTALLVGVYTFLWALLLLIPGIIKSYSYALTPYILKDEPELKYNAAIEKSMAMMDGHKMQLFLLDLSFIGWALLCILTCGIGFLWLVPYVALSRTAFYENLKAETVSVEDMSATKAE